MRVVLGTSLGVPRTRRETEVDLRVVLVMSLGVPRTREQRGHTVYSSNKRYSSGMSLGIPRTKNMGTEMTV